MAVVDLFASLRSLFSRRRDAAPVVIGSEMAQAQAAEAQHAALRDAGPSPMAGLRYAPEAARLWRWEETPLDAAIAALASDYAALPAPARAQMRASLTMDDFYEVLTFTRRAGLAALRGGDAGPLAPAFTALAMIEQARIDWRDLTVATGLVCGAGRIVGAPVAEWVDRAAALAEPGCAKTLREFRTAKPDLAATCGLRAVETAEGVVLFDTGFCRYAPRAELAGMALACAHGLEAQGYIIESFTLARDLPPVWLGAAEGSRLARIAKGLTGCVSLSGHLQADPDPWESGQHLLVFLGEARSAAEAAAIAQAAQERGDADCSQIGIVSGKLCALVIQRSVLSGTPPMESPEGLERLRPLLEGHMR